MKATLGLLQQTSKSLEWFKLTGKSEYGTDKVQHSLKEDNKTQTLNIKHSHDKQGNMNPETKRKRSIIVNSEITEMTELSNKGNIQIFKGKGK